MQTYRGVPILDNRALWYSYSTKEAFAEKIIAV